MWHSRIDHCLPGDLTRAKPANNIPSMCGEGLLVLLLDPKARFLSPIVIEMNTELGRKKAGAVYYRKLVYEET